MRNIVVIVLSAFIMLTFSACGAEAEKKSQSEGNKAYVESLNIEKVDQYLYSCKYKDYDYDLISKELGKIYKSGGCSAVRNGNFVGRNFDWKSDKEAYFIMMTPAGNGRYATLGLSGAIPGLTQKTVDSGKWVSAYKTLPFVTLDGINDQGLVCTSLKAAKGDFENGTVANNKGEDLCALMLTRYVLDNAGNVDEAIKLLKQRNVYMPGRDDVVQEYHWMISDPKKSVVIEYDGKEMKMFEGENILTNFYLNGFDKSQQSLPKYATGIERYNILRDNYDSSNTNEGMINLMKSVWYSKVYNTDTVPFWYSEYSGDYGDDSYGTLDSTNFGDPDLSVDQYWRAGAYKQCIMDRVSLYREETLWGKNKRDGDTQHTCYTSVYDMQNLTLTILSQEKDSQYSFKIKK